MKLKLERAGDEVAMVLPEALLERLGVGPGDYLHVVDASSGRVTLSAKESTYEKTKLAAREYAKAARASERR